MIPSKPQNIGILWGYCKLYHKTTWFETDKRLLPITKGNQLQIISQNYVVWNKGARDICAICDKIANYITKLRGLKRVFKRSGAPRLFILQIISQNYVVWNIWATAWVIASSLIANYITKLRGLKQNKQKHNDHARKNCKLYHKTTWFETQ